MQVVDRLTIKFSIVENPCRKSASVTTLHIIYNINIHFIGLLNR